VATAHVSAIQDVLHRQVNLNAFALLSNFDAVTEGRHTAMCPARATILRNVLVQGLGAIALAVDVAPIVAGWEDGFSQCLVRGRLSCISAPDDTGCLILLLVPDQAMELNSRHCWHNAGKQESLGKSH